jgi:hypothetical protein
VRGFQDLVRLRAISELEHIDSQKPNWNKSIPRNRTGTNRFQESTRATTLRFLAQSRQDFTNGQRRKQGRGVSL